MTCPQGHAFDVARRGYISLLQPQDRRSKEPGDSRAAVEARRRLHDRGFTAPVLEAVGTTARLSSSDVVLDVGCGDGFYLGNLAAQFDFQGHGVDISTAAVDAAARRYRHCQWVVANADRFLPYATGSFSFVMTITARQNAAEFHRVLRANGRLLVAVPAADDLIEIRGAGHDRIEQTIECFKPQFALTELSRWTSTADVDEAAVADFRLSIYRPLGKTAIKQVTVSLDLLLFTAVKAQQHSSR